MESNKILVTVIAILLAAVAVEGAFLVVNNNNGTQNDTNEYAAFEGKINELNEKGGKIFYNNGNCNEITAGSNLVSMNGNCVIVKAHGTNKETISPISGIACITIYPS